MITPKALFSLHDVMPETLTACEVILDRVEKLQGSPPALLVVPGRDWTRGQLQRLRNWERRGCELLAHGWLHRTEPHGRWHRLHAALISRNVAEHLALDRDGIASLMRRSRQWFGEQGLALPRSYVPPAWALGLPAGQLGDAPYDTIETLTGVHLRTGRGDWQFRRLPLVGFEADTPSRALCLAALNRVSCNHARRRGLPLRIAIHPRDPELHLSGALQRLLHQPWDCHRYGDLRPSPAAGDALQSR